MRAKLLKVLFIITAFVLLMNVTTLALSQTSLTGQAECLDANYSSSDIQTMAAGINSPTQAYLVVGTTSYGAPNPNTGYAQETLPANTTVWVVEKVYCNATGSYYYYAGYTYNNQSHRGYFNEYNVYVNGAKLANSNVSGETIPAQLKQQTSLAGTVYDGPGTSYSVTGSVGQEYIKLIRTEGNFNFIEYTVTGTGKLKRGFLDYSKITGSWAALTEQNASKFNGKTFYLKNKGTHQYLSIESNSTQENARFKVEDFTGNTNQIFKFTYNSSGKYFTIQPAGGYNVTKRLAINHSSNSQHADKHLALKANAENTSQRFWVVPVGDGTIYKILPIGNYGTMTLTARPAYVNQYYTALTNLYDAWEIMDTTVETSAIYYSQEGKNWCWAASAKSMASAEEGFNPNAGYNSNIEYENPDSELEAAIIAYRGSAANLGGTPQDRARLTNYFVTGRYTDPLIYSYFDDKIYEEGILRRFIMDNHPVGLSMENSIYNHALTVVKFKWVDTQGSSTPGYYQYYYYNSNITELNNPRMARYNELVSDGIELGTGNMYWINTVVYSTSYSVETINVN